MPMKLNAIALELAWSSICISVFSESNVGAVGTLLHFMQTGPSGFTETDCTFIDLRLHIEERENPCQLLNSRE
jgi:hypothetical protein